MIDIIYKILAFLVTISVLITFHELGHYLVARWCGVKVLRFCIGFGRPFFLRKWGRDQTEWAVAALPIGGYVKMLDEREEPVPENEKQRAFNRQPSWKKIAIVVAGPLANFLLAIVFYAAVNWGGTEGVRTVIATPPPTSAAAAAGLAGRDEIIAVNGVAVPSWQELRWRLLLSLGSEDVQLQVRRGNAEFSTKLPLTGLSNQDWERNFPPLLGLIDDRVPLPPIVGHVDKSRTAAQAGLQVGDRILSIDDKKMNGAVDVIRAINSRPGEQIVMNIERNGAVLVFTVQTEHFEHEGRQIGRIGIAPHDDSAALAHLMTTVRYGFAEGLVHALRKTWEISVFSLRMLGRILIGKASLKNISGPVTMADYAGQTVQQGWEVYIKFLALISVSLGVLNLLPIPLLDGGHLLYHSIEWVKGSPLPDRFLEVGQQIGIVILFALMGLALFNDIVRLLS